TCPLQCLCDVWSEFQRANCDNRGLSSVPAGILDNIQFLDLYSNRIEKLPEGVISRLVNLQHLHLYNNQLKSIPRGAFDNLKSLTHIWLFGNPWDC
uniref:Variable lymphocyte receptor B cassette n=1 Tax=Petromyzon marinus TaxID=7757 RepID=S4RKP4_PETMA